MVFADLAGSTELALQMDAEVLRDLLGDVYVTLARCAEAYGGTVEKFIGDAVMAVFGVPVAHEDDAERAVRAALLMRSRLAAVAERRAVPLVLRIGVNTGLVVTGTTPGRDFLVTGEAVNLAARLQQAAEPGEVLVGERTFRAVEPLVRMVAPRSLAVRGRTGPVTAYAVERFAPAGAYRRRRRPYGPFVGREVELTLIRSVVERAVEHSRAHLLTLIGEAGIGKSRLVEEAVVELRRSEDPPAVWVGRCLPYGESGPYAPLRDLLLRAAAVRADASREEIRARVMGQLQAILPEDSDEQIAELLRFVGGERMQPSMDGDEPGDRGRDAWRGLLLRMAARQPTLLVIEDAHWAEPALLELIASVVAGDVRVPLVVVCVARAELFVNHPGWGSGMRNETTVTLEALDPGEMRRLATALAATADPPPSVVDLAGGNPFFLEEILAMSGEGGGGDRVPETVQGVIAARLDLLDAQDKLLLQRAAVVGRSFTLEQLEPLLNGGGRGPTGRLRNLVDRDLIHHRGGGRHSFKHALIRDVAYESIPRGERARLHLLLAEELERVPEAGCQAIAGHYAAAATLGETAARAPAVRVLLQAAQEARSVEAHGLALRNAVLARQLADSDRERALAAEAAGDAHWMAEHLDDARAAYLDALELGIAAELGPEDTSRLRWKWVDLPTRWQGSLVTAPERERVSAEIETGLVEAREAGSVLTEARLLIAKALLVYRVETTVPPQEEALLVADRALELTEGPGQACDRVGCARRAIGAAPVGRPLRRGARDGRAQAGARAVAALARGADGRLLVRGPNADGARGFRRGHRRRRPGRRARRGQRQPLGGVAGAEQGRRALLVGQVGRGDQDVRAVHRRPARHRHRRAPSPPVTARPDARRRGGDPHAAGRDRGGRPARAAAAGIEPALRPRARPCLARRRRAGAGARALDGPAVPAALGARDPGRVAGPPRPLGRLRRGAGRPGSASGRRRAAARHRPGRPRAGHRRRRGRAGPGDRGVRAAGVRVRARALPRDRRRMRGGEGGLHPDGRRSGGGEGRALIN